MKYVFDSRAVAPRAESPDFPPDHPGLRLQTLVWHYADLALDFVRGVEEKAIWTPFDEGAPLEKITRSSPESFFQRCLKRDDTGVMASIMEAKAVLKATANVIDDNVARHPERLDESEVGSVCLAETSFSRLDTVAWQVACQKVERERNGELSVYLKTRRTLSSALDILPTTHAEHPLVMHIGRFFLECAHSVEMKHLRTLCALETGMHSFTPTIAGFELEFGLPPKLIRGDVISSTSTLREFFYSLCLKVENSPTLTDHMPGEYGDAFSGRSMLNGIGNHAPRLYDPAGNLRGRITEDRNHRDSLLNPAGRFGDPFSPESLECQAGQVANSANALRLAYGTWKIVSDGN